MKFEKIKIEDLDKLNQLSPNGWGDVASKIEIYLKLDFCHSVKLVENNVILGIGTAIFYKYTSWIAHLIVNEKYRKNGYGTQILNYLCDYCKNNTYKTILLFATDMGYPLYIKYGFKIQTEYVRYEKTIENEYNPNNIRNIEINDYEKIFELDKLITGEDRHILLLQYLNNGFVYHKNNNIMGFYLQNLGEGLIIANNEEAGLELLKLRIINNRNSTIPTDNIFGNNYFLKNKFKEIMKIRRMIYGNEIECKNENIYNRIGGNFG